MYQVLSCKKQNKNFKDAEECKEAHRGCCFVCDKIDCDGDMPSVSTCANNEPSAFMKKFNATCMTSSRIQFNPKADWFVCTYMCATKHVKFVSKVATSVYCNPSIVRDTPQVTSPNSRQGNGQKCFPPTPTNACVLSCACAAVGCAHRPGTFSSSLMRANYLYRASSSRRPDLDQQKLGFTEAPTYITSARRCVSTTRSVPNRPLAC